MKPLYSIVVPPFVNLSKCKVLASGSNQKKDFTWNCVYIVQTNFLEGNTEYSFVSHCNREICRGFDLFSVHFYIPHYVGVLSPTLKLRSTSKVSSLLDSQFSFHKKSSFLLYKPSKNGLWKIFKIKTKSFILYLSFF